MTRNVKISNCWTHRDWILKKSKEKNMEKADLDVLKKIVTDGNRQKFLIFAKKYFSWFFHNQIFIYPDFIDCYRFSGDIALVQIKNGSFGFINDKNKFILGAIYKDAYTFNDEFAIVESYGSYVLFDKKEKRFKYDKSFNTIDQVLDWNRKRKGINENA